MWNLGLLGAAGATVAAAGSYDLLQTETLASTTTSVVFSNLNNYSSDYDHLQLRINSRDNRSTTGGNNTTMRFNGDTGTNYRERHYVYGNGSVITAGDEGNDVYLIPYDSATGSSAANVYGPAVIDILDAFSSSKYTTIKSFRGFKEGTYNVVGVTSGLWLNTDAITSITLAPIIGSFVSGSDFSLYGLKAA